MGAFFPPLCSGNLSTLEWISSSRGDFQSLILVGVVHATCVLLCQQLPGACFFTGMEEAFLEYQRSFSESAITEESIPAYSRAKKKLEELLPFEQELVSYNMDP